MSAPFFGRMQKVVSGLCDQVWWLQGVNIARFLESVGLTLDSGTEALEQGLRFTQPLRCDSSALPELSRDREITLYPSEPIISQRQRLANWLPLRRQRGTHQGQLKHARPYFYPDTPLVRIVHQDGAGGRATWHTLNADGTYVISKSEPSNWNYDGTTPSWSRYWCILYIPSALYVATRYDDPSVQYDTDDLYDGVLSTQVALDMVAMVRDWGAPHSVLWAFIITTNAGSFDPEDAAQTDPAGWTTLPIGNWGTPMQGGVYTRPPYAHWIYTSYSGG